MRAGDHLEGTVEVDETYVGGKPRNRHWRKATEIRGESPAEARARKRPSGRGTSKTPVVAIVDRGGRVRARVIPDVSAANLRHAIRENVDMTRARLMTDELSGYVGIGAEFLGGHESVKHSIREYVRGDAHTNTVEGFFSILKRGIYGVFQHVSKKHLHRYVSEFEFRYNTRKLDDGERTVRAIRAAEGRRLMVGYRQPEAVGPFSHRAPITRPHATVMLPYCHRRLL